jgi:hypothetical protein
VAFATSTLNASQEAAHPIAAYLTWTTFALHPMIAYQTAAQKATASLLRIALHYQKKKENIAYQIWNAPTPFATIATATPIIQVSQAIAGIAQKVANAYQAAAFQKTALQAQAHLVSKIHLSNIANMIMTAIITIVSTDYARAL